MALITRNVIHAIHEAALLPRYKKIAPSLKLLHKLSARSLNRSRR